MEVVCVAGSNQSLSNKSFNYASHKDDSKSSRARSLDCFVAALLAKTIQNPRARPLDCFVTALLAKTIQNPTVQGHVALAPVQYYFRSRRCEKRSDEAI